MKKPNFFIVGAAKSGTTSLYKYLEEHIDVYMSPIKEPHYFSKDIKLSDFNKKYRQRVEFDILSYLSKAALEKKHLAHIENLDSYIQLYREHKGEKYLGEVSTGYLYSNVAAKEIYNFNPNAKIIIILRSPIERAFSHWIMGIQLGIVNSSSFLDDVVNDYKLENKGWGVSHTYIELGLYYEQVKRYYSVFPSENIKVFLFDDLIDNPEKVGNSLFEFLNIDKLKYIDFKKKYNVTKIPKNNIISIIARSKLIKKILPKNIKIFFKNILFSQKNLPTLTNFDRERLLPYFLDDIKKLEQLIDRDLSAWYRCNK